MTFVGETVIGKAESFRKEQIKCNLKESKNFHEISEDYFWRRLQKIYPDIKGW